MLSNFPPVTASPLVCQCSCTTAGHNVSMSINYLFLKVCLPPTKRMLLIFYYQLILIDSFFFCFLGRNVKHIYSCNSSSFGSNNKLPVALPRMLYRQSGQVLLAMSHGSTHDLWNSWEHGRIRSSWNQKYFNIFNVTEGDIYKSCFTHKTNLNYLYLLYQYF